MVPRWRALVLILLGLLIAGSTVFYFVNLRPWLTFPSESEESIRTRWARVEKWAEVPPATRGDTHLRTAVRLTDSYLGRGNKPVAFADLDADVRRGLTELETWSTREGGFAPGTCDAPSVPTLKLVKLGQLALASAEATDVDRALAAAHLGAVVRRRGVTLLEVLVGFNIASDVAKWAKRVSGKLPSSFAPHAPTGSELHAAYAREAVCSAQLVDALRDGYQLDTLGVSLRQSENPPLGLIDGRREKLLLRASYATLVEEMYTHRDDPRRMVEAQRAHSKGLPKSVVLQMMAITPSVSDRAVEAIEAYAAALK